MIPHLYIYQYQLHDTTFVHIPVSTTRYHIYTYIPVSTTYMILHLYQYQLYDTTLIHIPVSTTRYHIYTYTSINYMIPLPIIRYHTYTYTSTNYTILHLYQYQLHDTTLALISVTTTPLGQGNIQYIVNIATQRHAIIDVADFSHVNIITYAMCNASQNIATYHNVVPQNQAHKANTHQQSLKFLIQPLTTHNYVDDTKHQLNNLT